MEKTTMKENSTRGGLYNDIIRRWLGSLSTPEDLIGGRAIEPPACTPFVC